MHDELQYVYTKITKITEIMQDVVNKQNKTKSVLIKPTLTREYEHKTNL